jgi:hypothetical protein
MACVSKRRGRWIVDFTDLNGKRRWITMPDGGTKKKAIETLREIEDQMARRVYLPEQSIPKCSKVAEQWIKYKRANLRESTYSVYKGHTKNHFGELDSLKVNRITTAKIGEANRSGAGNDDGIETMAACLSEKSAAIDFPE